MSVRANPAPQFDMERALRYRDQVSEALSTGAVGICGQECVAVLAETESQAESIRQSEAIKQTPEGDLFFESEEGDIVTINLEVTGPAVAY